MKRGRDWAEHYLQAARVPRTLEPQTHGLWEIRRLAAPDPELCRQIGIEPVGWPDYTLLYCHTEATLHLDHGAIVMEDGAHELRQHLPIWMNARGRVLVTGLGLGCVVRGLLANPHVSHVDVVELDPWICQTVWPSVPNDGRASLHLGDAFKFIENSDMEWDYAWHDLWIPKGSLHQVHLSLMTIANSRVGRQGCWGLDRRIRQMLRRRWPEPVLGIPRRRRA